MPVLAQNQEALLYFMRANTCYNAFCTTICKRTNAESSVCIDVDCVPRNRRQVVVDLYLTRISRVEQCCTDNVTTVTIYWWQSLETDAT